PILDWTLSPWVAAYFAFMDCSGAAGNSVAVWTLDRSKIPPAANIEFIDDLELIRANERALKQRGVFLRVSTIAQSIDVLLDPALRRIEIPATDRDDALNDLDAMTITATTLFSDLDGAAKAATTRVRSN